MPGNACPSLGCRQMEKRSGIHVRRLRFLRRDFHIRHDSPDEARAAIASGIHNRLHLLIPRRQRLPGWR